MLKIRWVVIHVTRKCLNYLDAMRFMSIVFNNYVMLSRVVCGHAMWHVLLHMTGELYPTGTTREVTRGSVIEIVWAGM